MKTAISGINNGDPSLREKGIDKAEVLEGPEGIEALADCLASGKRFAILSWRRDIKVSWDPS